MTRLGRMIGRIRGSRLVSNSSIYLGGTLLNRLFPFFLTPLYTRTMSPHEFGVWGFCMTVLNALLIVTDLGIGNATTRLYWDHSGPAAVDRFLTVSFVTRILVSLGATLCLAWPLMAGWPWLSGGVVPVLPFVPLLLGGAALQAIVAFDLQVARVTQDPVLFSKIQIGQTILQSAVGAALVLLGWGAAGPIVGYLAGALVTAGVCGVAFVRRYGTRTGLDWQVARASVGYGIGTVPINASTWLRRMADRAMVGRAITMSSLALYQLAASAMAPLTILMGSINAAYLPYYFEQRKRGGSVLPRLVAIDTLLIAALSAISLATIAVAPELIAILAPPSYAAAATLAPGFVLMAFFSSLSLQFTKELLFLKRAKLTGMIALVPSLCGVAANVFVIPRFGAPGAVIVGTVVGVVSLIASIAITRRIENSGHDLVRMAGACLVTVAFAIALSLRPFVPFAPMSLAIRLLAALSCLGGVVLILSAWTAWRTLNDRRPLES